jgi:hypothetical protein
METFVVRVWTPGEPEREGPRPLQGLLERVRDGERLRFDGGLELIRHLESAVAASTGERRPHDS